ncbi:MAG: glycosyltransferase family 2 protein [Candidatus Competibacteraceae bacterium]|nr:glycosyltransferase family 2 protein [Candidatus Competibacteraceae bacterium]
MSDILALTALGCALLPAMLFFLNLPLFRPPPPPRAPGRPVSVLIPARNEERSIEACVRSVLASTGVELEVVVLDDASTDATPAIVRRLAAEDQRVRLESAPSLPPDWCGKQHACAVLGQRARHPLLLFIDADVRLSPDGVARTAAFLEQSGAALVSGFPRQETVTWLERLVIPLIHFVLLGFLPLALMRLSRQPGFGAGCGQLILVERQAYRQVGGHGAIRTSLHDGVKLPRLLRRAGHRTDLFDATSVAVCRMYHNAPQVWLGLAKNATEGMAAPASIGFFTLVLGLGQVLPLPLLLGSLAIGAPEPVILTALAATLAAYLPRLLAVVRFRQPLDAALLHPLGILLLLVIQWQALILKLLGRPVGWKGRHYQATEQPRHG